MSKVNRPYESFRDIPQFVEDGHYRIHVSWDYLEEQLEHLFDHTPGLNLDPDFQRAHVWKRKQRIAYVEFMLRGGRGAEQLRFNCAGWQADYEGPFVLVDGKQRLTAVRMFLANELPAFGRLRSEFKGKLDIIRHYFEFMVNNLRTRKEVLMWYLQLNTGGTPHTTKEIARVKGLLVKEQGRLREESRDAV